MIARIVAGLFILAASQALLIVGSARDNTGMIVAALVGTIYALYVMLTAGRSR